MKRVCAQCFKNRIETQYSSTRAKICNPCKKKTRQEQARRAHLKKFYDITLEEYDQIFEAQGGKCAICRGVRPYLLHVDHDHEIEVAFSIREAIRGLLCKRCNKLLRDIRDDVTILQAAVEYRLNPPAKKVLFP